MGQPAIRGQRQRHDRHEPEQRHAHVSHERKPVVATTNGSGIATFFLRINNSGLGYTLAATTESASATSSGFDIANQVNLCTGTCTATGNTATQRRRRPRRASGARPRSRAGLAPRLLLRRQIPGWA